MSEWSNVLYPAKAGRVAKEEYMPYVYIIKSEEGRYYIGSCVDIDTRLKRHNAHTGGTTTKGHIWKLVYSEEFKDIQEARVREKKIKSYKGGNAFKKLIV